MRQILLSLLICSSFFAQAQKKISINSDVAGNLSNVMTSEQIANVEDITITGIVNKEDILFLSSLISDNKLRRIDMGNATSVDGYMTFNFRASYDKELYPYTNGWEPVSFISMPKYDTFTLDIPYASYVDTIQINSRVVNKAFGNPLNGSTSDYTPKHRIRKIILNEGVEIIKQFAFLANTVSVVEPYIVDAFPTTLKIIEPSAFYDRSNKYRTNVFVSPNIVFPEGIEQIGSPIAYGSDKGDSMFQSWLDGDYLIHGTKISLPKHLKYFNGTRRYSSDWIRCTIIECDTLIIPESMQLLSCNIIADVVICHSPSCPLESCSFDIGTLYVPKEAYTEYKQKYSAYGGISAIKEYIDVTDIHIATTNKKLYIGEQLLLKSDILPINATYKNCTWSSSNTTVATISEAGIVRALNAGRVTIKATADNGINDSLEIDVLQHVTGLQLSPKQITIQNGNVANIIATVAPDSASDKSIIWKSSNPGICDVSNGLLTALSPGTSVISATTNDGGFVDNCVVTITQPISTISVSQQELSLCIGSSHLLSAKALPENATDKNLCWTSSCEDIVTVNDGYIKGISAGEAIITVSSVEQPSIKDICHVTVIQPVINISITDPEIELKVGNTYKLVAEVSPGNATNTSVNWMSSDNSVAMVSQDGTVIGINPGKATIMASSVDGGFMAICNVTVIPTYTYAESISLNTSSLRLQEHESYQLYAFISPNNVTEMNVQWSSSDESVATVVEGCVSALNCGSAVISATTIDGTNLLASCTVEVVKLVQDIVFEARDLEIEVGDTYQLNAYPVPTTATNTTLSYQSSNEHIITVDQKGLVTAIAEGVALITISSNDGTNISKHCDFKVVKYVHEIVVNPTTANLMVDEIMPIDAYVLPANATNTYLNFSSSNEAIASITNQGVVTAIAEGEAVITVAARDNSGVTAQCVINVGSKSNITELTPGSNLVSIYSIKGVLIKKDVPMSDISKLCPGVYVICKPDGKNEKLVVRG